jgi:polyisoprenoid-binding protein YceI
MNRKHILAVLLIVGFNTISMAQSAQYEIDSDHTSINFTIRHLVISKVKGKFAKFTALCANRLLDT